MPSRQALKPEVMPGIMKHNAARLLRALRARISS